MSERRQSKISQKFRLEGIILYRFVLYIIILYNLLTTLAMPRGLLIQFCDNISLGGIELTYTRAYDSSKNLTHLLRSTFINVSRGNTMFCIFIMF